MLDARTEDALARLTADVRQVFGTGLVSLVLYGSAAGDDFVPGRSNLNLAIVVDRLAFAHLKALHRHLPKWHRLGAAMPLLLDRRWIERSHDVFPMEFCDIRAQHRVLYGEEVFATLRIDRHHLRYQSEHEARGKLLRLRALYAEVGADRTRLEHLMLDSVKTFVIVMRNCLRVRGAEAPSGYLAVVDQFEALCAAAFPTMRHLIAVRLGTQRWADDIEETFASYLGEVERLIDLLDCLSPDHDRADA